MSTATSIYPHINKPSDAPARLVDNPRWRVAQIIGFHLSHGWSADEMKRQFPHLGMSEIYAAFLYYYDHPEEINKELEDEWREVEEDYAKHQNTPFVKRLLALRAVHGCE